MAGHAGRSPSFRFADAWLAGRGAPLRRHGPPRAGPRAGRADRLAQRPGQAVPVGGGEGAARPGGAAGAGASARPAPFPTRPPRPRSRTRTSPAPRWPAAGRTPARSRPVRWAARPDVGCGRRWWSAAIPLAGRARPAPGSASGSARSATASPAGPASGPRPGGWRPGTRGPDGPPGPAPPAPGGWSAATASSRCPASRAYGLAPEVLRMAAARVADGREARYPGPSRGVLHPRRPGALRIPPSPRGLDRRRARRRAQGGGRHGARPGAGEGWRGAPRQAGRRPAGALAGACDGADIDRAERGYGRSAHDLRADPPAGRRHGPGLAGEHGRGAAGRPAGGGGGNGRVPAAAGPGGDHGARSGAALRGDRRPLPPRARRPGHAGHHDPEPHRPPGDGGAGRSRRRRKARLRRPRPRRAGGHGPGPPAGPVRHGRGPARRPGGGQPPPGGRAGPRPGAGGRPRGHAGGLRPRPRGRLPGAARQGGGRGDAPPARPGRSARRRVRTPDGGEMCLRERAAALPAIAVPEPAIPASGGPGARKGRTARPGIRAAEVTVMPPGDGERRAEPPRWLPLTAGRPARGEADAVHAATVPGRCRRRWTVETWSETPGPAPDWRTGAPAPPTARASRRPLAFRPLPRRSCAS